MNPVPSTDIAYRLLKLEQQLESYQRLHAEELAEMRRALAELKAQVLANTRSEIPDQVKPKEEERDE